ncbi:ABC transporter permease [Clostridium ganghwense]|uniref:ABC transporter permease n=1 Tax=Clostridium ganghwense TaxID=312089 RepID=A0ABT4CK72_9CLOT|nr:ABC transporter permease [Clostridium ganghwense]MCY6369318.1 ABC transporter permease [Clostridium ganghwense]
MNWQRFISIIKKEFIQIKRDKFSAKIIILMPIMMIFLFGYAVNTDLEDINIAVFDQSRTQESRTYINKFTNSNYFIPKYYVNSTNELNYLIDNGDAKAGLIIPPNFTEKLKKGKQAQGQLIIDGTDPTIARTALSSGQLISQNYSMQNTQKNLSKKGIALNKTSLLSIDLRTNVWYNPNLKSTLFTIPGVIGLILQNITVMLTAFALVRERERSTIEQLIVTPIKTRELILGKMIPYILIGYVDFLFVLGIGTMWFGLPINGSLPLLLLLGFEFVIVALAIGMWISTITINQLQAMQATMLFILPSFLLSGFVFPRESMPKIIQIMGNLIPLTFFLKIARGIILKGVGMEYLWKDTLILGILGILILSFSILNFKKNLE